MQPANVDSRRRVRWGVGTAVMRWRRCILLRVVKPILSVKMAVMFQAQSNGTLVYGLGVVGTLDFVVVKQKIKSLVFVQHRQ